MALADNRRQRTFMLCAMYFAQGVPWGFMATAVVSYLTEQGISDAEAGKLSAVVLVPWTFKLVWGPLIDTVTVPGMGRRRPWIIAAEFFMALSLLGLLAMGDLSQDLERLAWMFFLHNCFASLQDVSTDALAVDILPPAEQGRMNALMWCTKLVGRGVGAAGMAYVMKYLGIAAAVMVQFVILMIIMLIPILMLEREGEKRFPWSPGVTAEQSPWKAVRNPIDVLKDLVRGFSLTTTWVFFLFGIISLIGWGLVEIITKTLCTQQLGWEFTDYSEVSGWAIFFEISGCLFGGWLVGRFGRKTAMTGGWGAYGLLAAVFAVTPGLWEQPGFLTTYMLLNAFVLPVGTVGFLSMGMRISWTRASATMFTSFMTVSNVGHVIGNWLAGPFRNNLGLSYQATFLVVGLLMIVPLFLLLLVEPRKVDEMKAQDAAGKLRAEPAAETENHITGT